MSYRTSKLFGGVAAALTAVLIAGLIVGYVEAGYEASHLSIVHARISRVEPLPGGGLSVTLEATLRNSGVADIVLLNPRYSLSVGGAEVGHSTQPQAISLKAGSAVNLTIPMAVGGGGPAARLESVLGGTPGASLTLTAEIPVKLFGIIPIHPLTVQAYVGGG